MVSPSDIDGSVGIDEGWEGCGMGVNHTQHYGNGTPAVNAKFPDMKGLVEYGHSKKLRMGFCGCPSSPLSTASLPGGQWGEMILYSETGRIRRLEERSASAGPK